MPSIAEKVAYKVVETSEAGKHISIVEAAKQAGVVTKYATSGNLAKTKSFQAVIQKWRDKTAKQLQKKATIALSLITKESLSEHNAKDLMQIIDTGIKNTQLLTGGKTGDTPQPIIQVLNFTATQVNVPSQVDDKTEKV